MRFPKLPARRDDETEPETEAVEPKSGPPSPRPNTGYTVAMPELPPPPLTSELCNSIRFTVSKPQGYYFVQVETFVQQVIETLAYYEDAEFRLKQTLYDSQVEVDQQAYDAQRLRSEIELFKVTGSPMTNPDGSYLTESQQDAAAEELASDLSAARADLATYAQAVHDRDIEVVRLTDLVGAYEQESATVRTWGEQVAVDLTAMRDYATALEEQIATMQASAAAPVEVPSVPADLDEMPVEQPAFVQPVFEQPEVDGAEMAPSLESIEVYAPVSVDAEQAEVTYEPEQVEVHYEPEQVAPVPALDLVQVPSLRLPHPAPEDADDEDADDEYGTDEYGTDDEDAAEEGAAEHSDPSDTAPEPVEAYAPEPVEVYAPEPVETDYQAALASLASEAEAAEPAPAREDDAPVEAEESYASDEPVIQDEVPVHDPYEAFDEYEAHESVAVVPVDSELPEGTLSPGTGEAAITYPHAAPGIPLETHGVPVNVWAPELDPRITAAIQEEAQATRQPATGPVPEDTTPDDE